MLPKIFFDFYLFIGAKQGHAGFHGCTRPSWNFTPFATVTRTARFFLQSCGVGSLRRILAASGWRRLVIAVGVAVLATGIAGAADPAAAARSVNPGNLTTPANRINAPNRISPAQALTPRTT